MMNQEARLDYLNHYLLEENPNDEALHSQKGAPSLDEKIALFRGLCNIREPEPVTEQFLEIQDAFLTEWNQERKITSLKDLEEVKPQLYIFQGDITSLAVSGIVNAANSELLGCLLPNHNCIDNIIHTHAGVQLRLECNRIMEAQGRKEPVGKAKITNAYNLPADYVVHTVGPYIDERGVTPLKEELLGSSYRSCLQIADEHGLESIAFCCISTGEFNFPNERAAEIAVQTVQAYLNATKSNLKVVFNVFKDIDFEIYRNILVGKE
ncbi:protein-ADP-ribose hydrolase [Oceanobacillus alkalisoli]|uniref:protein-ADP-ribose hydrolase n=1 Tax=Oceanobacillus alkalisoli TaxID=2925113 RepID=UPI003F6ED440